MCKHAVSDLLNLTGSDQRLRLHGGESHLLKAADANVRVVADTEPAAVVDFEKTFHEAPVKAPPVRVEGLPQVDGYFPPILVSADAAPHAARVWQGSVFSPGPAGGDGVSDLHGW